MSRKRLIAHGRISAPADTTPDAFTFTDVTGVATSTVETSNTITVSGLGSGVSVAVTVSGGTYSKNGGSYTSSAGTAVNGDTFSVRHTSSGAGSTATNTTLTIGGVSDTFTSTTSASGAMAITFRDPGVGFTTDSATGWHTFPVKSGAKQVWWNPSAANDSGDGYSYATAKKTESAALTLWLSGNGGDRLMVPYGSTFTQPSSFSSTWTQFGSLDDAYPTGIQSYDPADPTNSAHWGRGVGADMAKVVGRDPAVGNSFFAAALYFGDTTNRGSSNFFIQGVELASPSGAGLVAMVFNGPRRNITFQNFRLNNVGLSIQADGNGRPSNILLSKFAAFGQYNADGSPATGVYIDKADGFWEQDGIYYHCGWPIGQTRDGWASVFCHDNYLHAGCTNCHSNRINHIDGANDATNHRSGSGNSQIFCWDMPIAYTCGGFSSAGSEAPSGVVVTLDDAVAVGGARINSTSPRNWLIQWENLNSGSYINNILGFDSPNKADSGATLFYENDSMSLLSDVYLTVSNLRTHNYCTVYFQERGTATTPARHLTVNGARVDTLTNNRTITGTSLTDVSVHSGSTTYPTAVTRLQFAQNVATAMGISSSGTYDDVKGRIVNMMLYRPDIQWAPMFMKETLPKFGLTPTYDTLNFPDMSAVTPPSIYSAVS